MSRPRRDRPAASCVTLGATVVTGAVVSSRRAAFVDPVRVLRSEQRRRDRATVDHRGPGDSSGSGRSILLGEKTVETPSGLVEDLPGFFDLLVRTGLSDLERRPSQPQDGTAELREPVDIVAAHLLGL